MDGVDAFLVRQLGLGDSRDSLVATIACQVAREIIEGQIPPGGDLNSLELARRFDTSRTPVREALLLLKNEGLVEVPPRRRPHAAVLSVNVVREIYLMRAELHALAGRRIAVPGTDLAPLATALGEMSAAASDNNLDTYFWANVVFHERVATATGDSTLKRTLDGLGLRVLQLRHLSLSQPNRIQRSVMDHQRFLLAVQEQDADLAAALNRSIVLSALKLLVETIGRAEHGAGASGTARSGQSPDGAGIRLRRAAAEA